MAYLVLFSGEKQAEWTQGRQLANMASTGVLIKPSVNRTHAKCQNGSSSNTLRTADKHKAHTYLCSRKVA